jgi:7-cyano-7-deazaguanine synthase
MREAVVLLSGGLDSSTLLHVLLEEKFTPTALAVYYGQAHSIELSSAYNVARDVGVRIVDLDLEETARQIFAGAKSSQVGQQIAVPEGHYASESMKSTIVPNRNMLLLALAGAFAESIGAEVVAYAAHAGDHPIYPDCRPEFISSCAQTLKLGTNVTLYAPFQAMSKADIVRKGAALCVPFDLTYSCYAGYGDHCGRCGTCVERKEAFRIAQVPDPTSYTDEAFGVPVFRTV